MMPLSEAVHTIKDEEIDAAERAQQTRVAAVAARQSEITEQSRDTLIEHGAVVAAGFIAERRGEPALADAGRTTDQKIGVVVDPLAFDQHRQEAAVQAARGAIVSHVLKSATSCGSAGTAPTAADRQRPSSTRCRRKSLAP